MCCASLCEATLLVQQIVYSVQDASKVHKLLTKQCTNTLPFREVRSSSTEPEVEVDVEELQQLLECQSLLTRRLEVAIHHRTLAGMWEFLLSTCHCSHVQQNPSEKPVTNLLEYAN